MPDPQESRTKTESTRQEAHSSLMSILTPMHRLHHSLRIIQREDFEMNDSFSNPKVPVRSSEIHSTVSFHEIEYGPGNSSQNVTDGRRIGHKMTDSESFTLPPDNVLIPVFRADCKCQHISLSIQGDERRE